MLNASRLRLEFTKPKAWSKHLFAKDDLIHAYELTALNLNRFDITALGISREPQKVLLGELGSALKQ